MSEAEVSNSGEARSGLAHYRRGEPREEVLGPRRVALLGAGLMAASLVTFVVASFAGLGSSFASAVLWIYGWVAMMAGFVLLALASDVREKRRERYEEELMRSEPTAIGLDYSAPRIVMVRCRYCGTLNAEDVSKCHSCGANL